MERRQVERDLENSAVHCEPQEHGHNHPYVNSPPHRLERSHREVHKRRHPLLLHSVDCQTDPFSEGVRPVGIALVLELTLGNGEDTILVRDVLARKESCQILERAVVSQRADEGCFGQLQPSHITPRAAVMSLVMSVSDWLGTWTTPIVLSG